MVRSPLTAARATFALKAGEWFRRGRLLMVSPVHGDYRRCQAEIPLIVLFRFPGPALTYVRSAASGPYPVGILNTVAVCVGNLKALHCRSVVDIHPHIVRKRRTKIVRHRPAFIARKPVASHIAGGSISSISS